MVPFIFSIILSSVFMVPLCQEEEPGSQLEQQVILADCQVLLAILTFLQQEIGSYVKGGWVLRKAWKVYEHAYSKVKRMYKQTFGEVQDVPSKLIAYKCFYFISIVENICIQIKIHGWDMLCHH